MSPLVCLRKFPLSLMMLAVVALGSASIAKADSVLLQLNRGNGSSLPDQNYGTVLLNLNGNQIDVTVSMLFGARVIKTGQDCSICFNSPINPTISVSGVTAGYALISTNPGSLSADGYGTFEYGVNYTGGQGGSCVGNPTPCVSTVAFTVSTVGGFSTVNQLLENSINGGRSSVFAIDILCNTCPGLGSGVTGYVGTDGGTTFQEVPEPASMILLGTGLVGIATGVRRRRNARK